MKKNNHIEIKELFIVNGGFNENGQHRCFQGTIKREDNLVRGDIDINDGFILSIALDQNKLGNQLDEMVVMILDKGLHDDEGYYFTRYGFKYFMN